MITNICGDIIALITNKKPEFSEKVKSNPNVLPTIFKMIEPCTSLETRLAGHAMLLTVYRDDSDLLPTAEKGVDSFITHLFSELLDVQYFSLQSILFIADHPVFYPKLLTSEILTRLLFFAENGERSWPWFQYYSLQCLSRLGIYSNQLVRDLLKENTELWQKLSEKSFLQEHAKQILQLLHQKDQKELETSS